MCWMEGFLRSMTISYLQSQPITTRGDSVFREATSGTGRSGRGPAGSAPTGPVQPGPFQLVLEEAEPDSEAIARSSHAYRAEGSDAARGAAGSAGNASTVSGEAAQNDGPFLMPMQQSWTPPVIPEDQLASPLHPVYRVPMASPESLNRYFHPLQAVGAIGPNSTGTGEEIATTIYRVAPGGLQDFVTSDGFRHRFDVEIVLPAAGSILWQDREVTSIHAEVAEFATDQLRSKLEAAGMDVSKLEIEPFRMKGGTANRPWFFDQLILKQAGKEDLAISLNVAMRDPDYTVQTIRDRWEETTIPS